MTRFRAPLLLACLALPLTAQDAAAEEEIPVPAPNAELSLAADLDAPFGTHRFHYAVRLGPYDAPRRAEVSQRAVLEFSGGAFSALTVDFAASNRIEIGGSAPKITTVTGTPWEKPGKKWRLSARGGRLFLDEGGGERVLSPTEAATQKRRDESPLCWFSLLIGQDYRCRTAVGRLLERQLGLFDLERHAPRADLLLYTGTINPIRARTFFSEMDYDEAAIALLLRRFATVRVEADPRSGKLRAFAIRGMSGANPCEVIFAWEDGAPPAPPAGAPKPADPPLPAAPNPPAAKKAAPH